MAKRRYRAGTPSEENEYPSWIARNLHLKWPQRAKKYSIERKPQSKESLRTKYQLLQRDIRRHRPPLRKSSSRHRCRIPKPPIHDRRGAWLSRVSISIPTPSEYSPGGSPRPMRVRRPAPARVAGPRHDGQTARTRMAQGRQAIIKTSTQRETGRDVTRRQVEGSLNHLGTQQCVCLTLLGIELEKAGMIPSRWLRAPPKIDLLWKLLYPLPVAPGRRHERERTTWSAKRALREGYSGGGSFRRAYLPFPLDSQPLSYLRQAFGAYVLAYYNNLVCSARAMLVEGRLILNIDIHNGIARL
ncbi:hypothetical protein AtubIFM55763_001768 [Aspergillus tubingensis]|nr:hypothetical protein AtubIFM55763_001768 [Aspergillus tubingensis]